MRTALSLYSALVALTLVACGTNPDGSTVIGAPGSPAWFKTASPEVMREYFSRRCTAYGYVDATPEMNACIERDARAEIADNEAKARARASAPTVYETVEAPSVVPARPLFCRTRQVTPMMESTYCY